MYAKDTAVPVARTRAEIEVLLERHKAKQYGTAIDYDLLTARVQFRLQDRIVRFSVALPTTAVRRTPTANRHPPLEAEGAPHSAISTGLRPMSPQCARCCRRSMDSP